MPISTINQNGLTNPLTSLASNTVGSASGSALTLQSNGGTTAVTINTSQNVGIGTASPTAKFSIKNPNVSGVQTVMTVLGATSAVDLFAMTVNQTTDVVALGTNYAGSLAFNSNSTERMRIDSSGTVLLGTTSTSAFDSGFKAYTSGQVSISRTDGGTPLLLNTTADTNIIDFRRSSTNVGTISVTTSSTSYNTSSDYRLKENIAPMTGALAKVAQLKPVTYTWKSTGETSQGFIAHELQAVVPDCVTGEKDGEQMQGVDTSFLVATLTAAIQELKAEFDAYKASHP